VSIAEQKDLLPRVARRIFEEATSASLGSTFHIIISFHLQNKFGKDPYEALIEDPKSFYNGLKEVLGAGAEAVINLVGTFLTVKYKVNCTSEEFVELFTKDSPLSARKLSEIFQSIVTQEEQKLKQT
jgi:hypothetical protein